MLSLFRSPKSKLIDQSLALKGRETPILPEGRHLVLDVKLLAYNPNQSVKEGLETLIVGMGCFWGAERLFWRETGVICTSVGYAGGYTPNPTYEEVCSGQTGHTEVVQIDYDPKQTTLKKLLKIFWESHDPTQGMRQGNDIGTQYRSALYWTQESQRSVIEDSVIHFETLLKDGDVPSSSGGAVSTELCRLEHYYYAESYHQQYLQANPNGYCGLKGTGVICTL